MICRYLPPAGVGSVTPRDRSQLLAHPVDAVVIKLLFVEAVRIETELQNRNARRIELHNDRRLDPGRHERTDCVGRRYDLCNREIEIYIRLKIDFLDR